ncbi:MAG: FG-GAP-like repeat-containing protein [bacterium]
MTSPALVSSFARRVTTRSIARAIRASTLAILAAFPAASHAQTFTRILDAANPVVNDTLESGGGCWIDLDDDGRLELFVAHGNLSDQDNSLYWNDGAGGFARVSTGPIVNDGGSSIGGTFGDFDDDGRVDLFVTNRNNFGNFLYRGEGDSSFTRLTTGDPATDVANSNSSSWVDIDRDGDLDLYCVNFAGADFLYENGGGPGFNLVAVDTTAPQAGNAPTILGAWADYDNDRDADLFLAIAGTANDVLYRNDGGLVFTPTTFSDGRSTLGASWGDYDNDGDLDLVAANFVTQNNILYNNGGAPGFALTPVAGSPVATIAGNNIGTGWGDYDNDGDLDLFIARDGQNNLLFENGGPPTYAFTRVLTGSIVNDGGNSFGCVWGDYDADGALDLFVANRLNQADFLYHNDGNANHWLTVRCTGASPNRSAIGARVRVRATIGGSPRWQTRVVEAQSGYNSQNLDLHFGFGGATVAESLIVQWPIGDADTLLGIPLDALLRLSQGSPATGVGGPPGARGEAASRVALAQIGTGTSLAVRIVLPEAEEARLVLYDLAGRLVRTMWQGPREAGTHRIDCARPDELPSGVYVCRLSTAAGDRSIKIVQVR